MLNKFFPTLLMSAGLALAAGPLLAQDKSGTGNPAAALPDNVPALLVKANQSFNQKDYKTFRDALIRLRQLRPFNSEYMYQLTLAYALLDQKTDAYNLMLEMQRQGLSYDFTKTESSRNIRGTEVFDFLNDLMVMASTPVGESEVVFKLPADVTMTESLHWDESRQKFLLGTLDDGRILAVGKDGEVEELLRADNENGLWSVFDILVDQARNRLWVSSAATPRFARFDPIDTGRSALFEFNLETLELVHRYPVPVDGRPHVLGSMALGPAGEIYIVDRALPFIYSKSADAKKLELIIASTDMVSMRGVAMRPDGKIMYVADREMGILVLDMVEGVASSLAVPPTLNLGGIDGLYLWENRLFLIQNGISPQRVMRLQLDDSGKKVEKVRPLAVAQPEFDFPNFGTVHGEDLYFFANSYWSDAGQQHGPITVVKTPLDSSKDLEVPDMNKYIDERDRRMEAERQKAAEQAE